MERPEKRGSCHKVINRPDKPVPECRKYLFIRKHSKPANDRCCRMESPSTHTVADVIGQFLEFCCPQYNIRVRLYKRKNTALIQKVRRCQEIKMQDMALKGLHMLKEKAEPPRLFRRHYTKGILNCTDARERVADRAYTAYPSAYPGCIVPLFADKQGLKKPRRLDDLPGSLLQFAVNNSYLYIAVSLNPREVMDINIAIYLHPLLHASRVKASPEFIGIR